MILSALERYETESCGITNADVVIVASITGAKLSAFDKLR